MRGSSFRKTTQFAVALVGTSVRAAMALRGAFLLEMAFMALNNLIFFVFWWALFAKIPEIRGYRLAEIGLLNGIVTIGYGLAVVFAGGVREIGRLIDEGELDVFLAQPKPALLNVLGSRSQASGVGDVLSGIVVIVGFAEVPLARTPWIVLAVLASALVFVACGVLFWSLTFWLGRVEALARQLWEMVIIFSIYPESLFGGLLRVILFTALPAGFIGHLPVKLVRNPSVGLAAVLVGVSIVYAVVAAWVFGRGLRRYTSGSRFGLIG